MKVTEKLVQTMRRLSRRYEVHFSIGYLSRSSDLSTQQVREGIRTLIQEGKVESLPKNTFRLIPEKVR